MKVQNVVEQMVWDNLEKVLNKNPNICDCDKCRADIVAFALNKLKPRYTVSEKGATLVRAEALGVDMWVSILVALSEAAETVGANPKHARE